MGGEATHEAEKSHPRMILVMGKHDRSCQDEVAGRYLASTFSARKYFPVTSRLYRYENLTKDTLLILPEQPKLVQRSARSDPTV